MRALSFELRACSPAYLSLAVHEALMPKKWPRDSFISGPNLRSMPEAIAGRENQGLSTSTCQVVKDQSGLGIAVGFLGHRFHANDLAPAELDDDRSRGFSGFDEIGKSDEQLLGNIYFGAARGRCNVLRFCVGLRGNFIGRQSRRLALRVALLGELNRSTRKIGSYIGHRYLHSLFGCSQTVVANLGVIERGQ